MEKSRRLPRALWVLLLLGLLGLAVWVYLLPQKTPEMPLARVPSTGVGAIYLKAASFRQSWILVDLKRLAGISLDERAERCGALERVSEVTGFVTEEDAKFESVGFVVQGEFDEAVISECLRSALPGEKMAKLRADLQGYPAIKHGNSRLAIFNESTVVAGSESVVRSALEALSGKKSLGNNMMLHAVWEKVAPAADAVVVTRVPKRWREAMSTNLRESVPAIANALLPLRGVGLGLRLTGPQGVALAGVCVFPDGKRAMALSGAVQSKIKVALDNPLLGLSILGPVLRRVSVAVEGEQVLVHVHMNETRARSLFEIAVRKLGLAL